MATCTLSGTLVDPSETAVSGATIVFKISNAYANGSATKFFVPKDLSTTSASDGTWSLTLSQGISGIISIDYTKSNIAASNKLNYSIVVPATSTAVFNTLATEL